MNPLLLIAFWMAGRQPVSPAGNQNVVRICSLAEAGSCTDLDARSLDPTLPNFQGGFRGGQTAFIDPETKALVQPSAAQTEELALAVSLEESKARREPAQVETLPDGTLKLGPGSLFTVYLKASLKSAQPVEQKP